MSSMNIGTTAGTGDGSELSTNDTAFGLLSSDGSGNPPENQAVSELDYDKDKDVVQNMRNCFSLVRGFRDQINGILAASGYGGWTMICAGDKGYEDISSRLEGVLYLRVTDVIGTEADGGPYFLVEPESWDGKKMKFHADASTARYDRTIGSYNMSSTTVQGAIDELSNRSTIMRATIPKGSWTKQDSSGETFYQATVSGGVEGMLSNDYPNVTLDTVKISDQGLVDSMVQEAGYISRITTHDGYITAYCYGNHAPSVDISLVFRVLRGGNNDGL